MKVQTRKLSDTNYKEKLEIFRMTENSDRSTMRSILMFHKKKTIITTLQTPKEIITYWMMMSAIYWPPAIQEYLKKNIIDREKVLCLSWLCTKEIERWQWFAKLVTQEQIKYMKKNHKLLIWFTPNKWLYDVYIEKYWAIQVPLDDPLQTKLNEELWYEHIYVYKY